MRMVYTLVCISILFVIYYLQTYRQIYVEPFILSRNTTRNNKHTSTLNKTYINIDNKVNKVYEVVRHGLDHFKTNMNNLTTTISNINKYEINNFNEVIQIVYNETKLREMKSIGSLIKEKYVSNGNAEESEQLTDIQQQGLQFLFLSKQVDNSGFYQTSDSMINASNKSEHFVQPNDISSIKTISNTLANSIGIINEELKIMMDTSSDNNKSVVQYIIDKLIIKSDTFFINRLITFRDKYIVKESESKYEIQSLLLKDWFEYFNNNIYSHESNDKKTQYIKKVLSKTITLFQDLIDEE